MSATEISWELVFPSTYSFEVVLRENLCPNYEMIKLCQIPVYLVYHISIYNIKFFT